MAKSKTSKLTSSDGIIGLELVRKTTDYERDIITIVLKITVKGLDGYTEKVLTFASEDARKSVSKQDDQFNEWLIKEAIRKGLIPNGSIS